MVVFHCDTHHGFGEAVAGQDALIVPCAGAKTESEDNAHYGPGSARGIVKLSTSSIWVDFKEGAPSV